MSLRFDGSVHNHFNQEHHLTFRESFKTRRYQRAGGTLPRSLTEGHRHS